jgi:hypothetical protein
MTAFAQLRTFVDLYVSVMFRLAARAVTWAVDGVGGRFQGRPALGLVFIFMMLPVILNVIGMQVFGYSQGGVAYKWVTAATILCWFVAFSYLAAIVAYGLFRFAIMIWVAIFCGDSKQEN